MSTPAAYVEVAGVDVRFASDRGSVTALRGIDLSIRRGEMLTVLGPSGCGKSTLLRVIADLIEPSAGSVRIAGAPAALARQRKSIGFVFQQHTLLPWRSARANVELPLLVGRRSEEPRATQSVDALLDLVGLSERADALPHELSGGMCQRVAIARALVTGPGLLLMDEPFGALDEITRDRLNEEMVRIWERTGATIVFVTHSIPEALFLGRRVLVLATDPGRIVDVVVPDLPGERRLPIRDTDAFVRQAAHLRRLLERG